MHQSQAHFVHNLLRNQFRQVVVFGTSLSFHLAPVLRSILLSQFNENISVINSGQSAKASRTALQTVDDKVICHHPDLVFMEWAINDAHDYFHEPDALDAGISVEESRVNLETLIERVQSALPQCEIILWTTNPTFDAPDSTMRSGSARPYLDLYYEGVRAVASARGLRLVDAEKFWAAIRARDEDEFRACIPDGAHPTPKALREHLVPFLLRELGIPEQAL